LGSFDGVPPPLGEAFPPPDANRVREEVYAETAGKKNRRGLPPGGEETFDPKLPR
jgi:hypothetical protein